MPYVEPAARPRRSWTRGPLLILALLALLAAGGMAASAEEPLRATLDPASYQAEPGDTFTVNVKLHNVAELFAANVTIHFDPTVLQVVDADDDAGNGVQIAPSNEIWGAIPLLPCADCNRVDNTNGVIEYSAALLSSVGASRDGTLATIEFRAISRGVSPLTFDPEGTEGTVGEMLTTIPMAVSSGQVRVGTTNIYLPLVLRP